LEIVWKGYVNSRGKCAGGEKGFRPVPGKNKRTRSLSNLIVREGGGGIMEKRFYA